MPQRLSAALERLLDSARLTPIQLEADDDGVGVRLLQPPLAFHHSFIHGPMARRASQANQALLRACNNKSRSIENVLDLTAGWGADSLTLAHHGQQVTLVEQNALLHAILDYSLECLSMDPAGTGVAALMRLVSTEASDYLRCAEQLPEFDCIYLDPMFPIHKSGAKPAKEMQILQALTENLDIETCFELALQTARKRVVVKRPAKATSLTTQKPDIVYREKTIRFDVYLTNNPASPVAKKRLA